MNDFQVLHGAERGETAALLLSPLRPTFKGHRSVIDVTENGSQFTFFLTAPLQAFCLMVDLSVHNIDSVSWVETLYELPNDLFYLIFSYLFMVFWTQEVYEDAENILSTAFSECEVILCTSKTLDLVWAQVLSDPFLRRLLLRSLSSISSVKNFQFDIYPIKCWMPICWWLISKMLLADSFKW